MKYMAINFYLINFAANVGYYFISNSIEEMATHELMGSKVETLSNHWSLV